MCKSLITKSLSILFVLLISSSNSFSQDIAAMDAGKALFKTYCAQCHSKKMTNDMTGPALAGVQERWDGRDTELKAWIRNSQAFIATGDAYANELYNKWNGAIMNPFPDLTDEQIDNILAYIGGVTDKVYPPNVNGPKNNITADAGGDNTLLYGTLALILAILSLVLARIISNLNHMQKVKAGLPAPARKTLWEIMTGKGVIGFAIFALVIYGGYSTVTGAVDLGRQQGYAPDQPIKFSHETHAGLHEIDCNYCHDGARRSKHSVIPAANTCMNCHKAINVGSKYGTAEITKIFASIGWNPNGNATQQHYMEDYENMSESDIKKVYEKWIKTQFVAAYNQENAGNEIDTAHAKAQAAFDEQWAGIVDALKTEADGKEGKIQGPINWVRVHNLPDHVYFNHAQHVTVGKVECQQCHGPVEEMEILAQYAPLSMGWCVNCHRETDIQFADNEYYASYKTYHEEIASGKRQGVKVEEIGGIECQKCHY